MPASTKLFLSLPSFTVPSSFLHKPSVSGKNSKSTALSSPNRVTLLERVLLLSLNLTYSNTQERRLRRLLAWATPVSQYLHRYPAKMRSQKPTTDMPGSNPLRVTHCSLSPLHFELDARNVPNSSAVTLRISSSGKPVRALVLTGTSRCFISDSFYDEHIAKADFGGLKMAHNFQLADLGISCCNFDAVQGVASEGYRFNKPAIQHFPGRKLLVLFSCRSCWMATSSYTSFFYWIIFSFQKRFRLASPLFWEPIS